VDAHRVAPGYTVRVLGSFKLNSNTCITTKTSGTATAPITYTGGGTAKINGNAACFYIWLNNADYVRINGFDFTGVQTNTSTDSGTTVILSQGAGGNVTIDHNKIHNLPSGFSAAIAMEPYGTLGYTGAPCSVHDNIFHDLGYNSGLHHGNYAVYIACGTNSYVYNNLIYNEGSIGIHCWHAANRVHIYNNTVVNAQYIAILVGTGDSGGVSGAYFNVTNNIVVNSHYGITAESGSPGYVSTTSIFRNNLIYNNGANWYYNDYGNSTTLQAAGMSVTGTVAKNPLFVSPSASNYQLSIGSPAIGEGMYVGITHDLAGYAVSSNIGAY
jgi:hypothetical protein